MKFPSKGRQLNALCGKLKHARILPLEIIRSSDFFADKEKIILMLQNKFPSQKVIIRSSSVQEDTKQISSAGKFLSVLDIDSTDKIALKVAVENVFSSYGTPLPDDEVLIQPMLPDIFISGVAFTCDINTGAPYYVINYSQDGSTSTVTGGRGTSLKTYVVYKNKLEYIQESFMVTLANALCELEQFCNNGYLDVEFAITNSNKIFIFQVRPITNWYGKEARINLEEPLNMLYQRINESLAPHPFLLGDTTCYSVMSDFNPAELIGLRPKRLAISLFKEFVTDSIWARKRDSYTYRNLASHPAMLSFCGIPYIDVRLSFNSFIPRKLNKKTANKLVNFYMQKLKEYPACHDKIEFEIVQSCYYFGIEKYLQNLLYHNFLDTEINEIKNSLLELTDTVIHPEYGKYKGDINGIKKLLDKHKCVMDSDISLVGKIYWLIEECKKIGTSSYTGVARASFIAMQFLRSFVDCSIITNMEYNNFMSSLCTINRQMDQDYYSFIQGNKSKADFLKEYGHIRPNTYDILSLRYDEAFDMYFKEADKLLTSLPHDDVASKNSFLFTGEQKEKIQAGLDEAGLCLTSEQLLLFIKEAIEGREYAKFIFTRSVSEILRLIKQLGESMNIRLDDIAHLDIKTLKQLYVDVYYDNLGSILEQNINANKRQYEFTKTLNLPDFIRSPENVYSFYTLESKPTFITMKTISGEIISTNIFNSDLENKIVFIPTADPGYDFLFTKNIRGLITEYGGTNSHMAIRCAEMGIPAVIGAGAEFHRWKRERYLTIDCLNRSVGGY